MTAPFGESSVERRHTQRPQRVLVVDDSEDMRELWKMCLELWGFSVDQAVNGLEAVQKARHDLPALVLMDLWMPVLDGLKATAELKNDPTTASVPILALSAHTLPPVRENAAAAGCEVFLPKPTNPDDLIDAIRLVLGRSQATH